MQRLHTSEKVATSRTRSMSSFKRRPLPNAVDGAPREFVARLEAMLRDDCLQNICEVTQDPSGAEETFPFLPVSGYMFDRANKWTAIDKEMLAKGEKQAELHRYLENLKLSESTSVGVKTLEDSSIPRLYSEQRFCLRDVLNVMEEEGELSSEALLKKKEELTEHLTQVQSLLTANILEKKEAFKESITEVGQVQETLASVTRQVGNIRSQLEQVNDLFFDKMNDIHQTFQALKLGKLVLEKLEHIAEMMEAPNHVSLLLGSSDYLGAMQAIEQLRNIRRDKFGNIRCLDCVEKQLEKTLDDTIQVMRQDFVSCLDELIDEWTTEEIPVDLSWEDCVKQDVHSLSTAASQSVLNSLIMAAFRFGKLQYLVKYFVDRYFDLFLESTSHIGEQASNITDLETKRELVESFLTSCKWHVHRVALVLGLVYYLTTHSTFIDSNGHDEAFHFVNEFTEASWKQMKVRFCENISERLYEACSLILSNTAQQIDNDFRKNTWVEDHLISLQQFALICRQLEKISQQLCSIFEVSPSTVGGLRTFMLDSCRSYFQTIHNVAYKAMECFLKEERWSAVEFIPDVVVSCLEETRKIPLKTHLDSSFASRHLMNGRQESVHNEPPRKDFIQLEETESGNSEKEVYEEISSNTDEQQMMWSVLKATNHEKPVLLRLGNSRCFPITKSNIFLIKILYLYVQCVAYFPRGFIDREIIQKLVQMVRMVNQLTNQMVLAAGAIQTAGLKSISAKHLAVAYQSIHLLSQYMDMLLSALSTFVMVDQHTLSEFQKAQRELRDHQGQILAKLVSIMNERMVYHQKTVESMPWNNTQLLEQWEIPSPYIQSLVRELFILDRIFNSVGMEREWNDLSIRIISSYGEKLTNIYEGLKSMGATGRKRIVADIEFFVDNLNNMFGREKLGSYGLKNLQSLQNQLGAT
ncbi:Vacuolar protein sorting-associated protein 54 [Galdieria sulphuraria]|nr:Vacuolar protein sorting-associated protein 54 [Galdieria sulphuraria]